jgi:DNA-binding transcriptional ArsR family regulator
MSGEDDTYSTIFTALKHPLRRRILRRLQASPATYTELLNELSIENGLLNYHLESVKELLTKQEDGKYTLNEFGRAGAQLLQRVEEPITINAKASNIRRDLLIKMLSVAIIVVLSFSTWSLYSSNQALRSELAKQQNHNMALIYSLTTDNETYQAPTMIEATIWITNRNPYPVNFTPPSPFIYSGGYVGEDKIVTQIMGDWVFSQVAANTTMKLTTMRFSAAKAGYFEIAWGELRVVVKVV